MGVAGECALQETRIGGRFKTSHRAGPAPARMTTREPLAVLYDSRFCTTATSAFALRSCVLRLFWLPPSTLLHLSPLVSVSQFSVRWDWLVASLYANSFQDGPRASI